VAEILNKKNELESIRQKGRNHIIDNFDWELIALKYRQLLK
jgi:hypothetical protein